MESETECTDKTCTNVAAYALWMGTQFSRVQEVHESMSYDDGDLHPHVCEACLPRYEGLHGDKGEFVRPVEKLAADGGVVEDDTEHKKAERFWSRYDLPFDHDTCIKVRRSGLMRGSSGTGHASDTVVHLHVQESFKDGRLSRGEDSYLCENDSFVAFQGREERHVEDGESYVPAVTCETCLQRMDRWKTVDIDEEGQR